MSHRRVDGFSGLCANPDDLQTGFVDLLGQLIDGRVGRSANENRAPVLLDQLVHDGRGRHGLAGSRGTLRKWKNS